MKLSGKCIWNKKQLILVYFIRFYKKGMIFLSNTAKSEYTL